MILGTVLVCGERRLQGTVPLSLGLLPCSKGFEPRFEEKSPGCQQGPGLRKGILLMFFYNDQ